MLTMADARQLSDCTVFRDVTWAEAGARSLTTTFYVLDDVPALAEADDGGPAYALFWYRGAVVPAAGGLLTLSVTATPIAADHDRVVGEIQAAYGLEPAAPITVAPVPVDSGTVALSFAGQTSSDLATVLGGGQTSQTGEDRTTFAISLSADGAAILGGALAADFAVIHADFELSIPYVLDDVSLHVWCDVSASCTAAAALDVAGADLDAANLVSALTARQLAGVTRSTARPLSAEEDQALTALADTVLADVLPPALLDATGHPRPYDSSMEQQLNLTLTATYPAVRSSALSANLTLPAGGQWQPSRVETFDVGADDLLARVEVSAPGDLAAHGIDAIAVRVDYSGTTHAGAVIQRSVDAVLRSAAPTAVLTFDLATTDQRSFGTHVEVHFTGGGAPYAYDLPASDSDVLELDIDALGVVRVVATLGIVDPALGATATIDFSYGTTNTFDSTQILDASVPTATWLAVVREVTDSYRWRVSWLAGAVRVVGDWQDETRRQLVLDAPPSLTPPTAQVTFISAGDFDAVAEILVEVRDSSDAAVSVLTFTATDQSTTWTTATVPPTYQLRSTVALTDGTHVTGAWLDDTRTVQVVRDSLRYVVTLVASLLDLGGSLRTAVVELQGPDDSSPVSTVTISDRAQQPTCVLRLLDPSDHTYRYRLTVSPSSGAPVVSDWRNETSTLLILQLLT